MESFKKWDFRRGDDFHTVTNNETLYRYESTDGQQFWLKTFEVSDNSHFRVAFGLARSFGQCPTTFAIDQCVWAWDLATFGFRREDQKPLIYSWNFERILFYTKFFYFIQLMYYKRQYLLFVGTLLIVASSLPSDLPPPYGPNLFSKKPQSLYNLMLSLLGSVD